MEQPKVGCERNVLEEVIGASGANEGFAKSRLERRENNLGDLHEIEPRIIDDEVVMEWELRIDHKERPEIMIPLLLAFFDNASGFFY